MRNKIFVGLFWLILWQAAAWLVSSELLLPGPVDAAAALAGLMKTEKFYMDIGWTMLRCVMAMGLSFAAGVLCAALSYKVDAARHLLSLPVGFFKAVPVMAIIIYVILVAESNWVAVIVCFLMCFPIVYTNILSGLDAMPPEYLEVAKVYGMTGMQRARLIYAPGLLPQIKSAVSLTAGLSWKAVVAAEVLSIPKYSLGYEMINAKYYLQTAELFAYILVIVLLSMSFEGLIKKGLAQIEWHGYEGSRLRKGVSAGSAFGHGNVMKKPMAPRVSVHHLSKSFENKSVLDDVDMAFEAGKVTAVMGPSGQGKTTLARIIAGLEKPDSGTVEMDGTDDLSTGETICRTDISFLFQEDRLLPWLNIFDNIAVSLGRKVGYSVGGNDGFSGQIHSCGSERIMRLAESLEIRDELWKLPMELSGGMKHRAALARTFAADTSILILDEPFRGLDEALKQRVIERLWKRETEGRTVILITHSQHDAETLAERIVKLGS